MFGLIAGAFTTFGHIIKNPQRKNGSAATVHQRKRSDAVNSGRATELFCLCFATTVSAKCRIAMIGTDTNSIVGPQERVGLEVAGI
jgi:hypothetical protein